MGTMDTMGTLGLTNEMTAEMLAEIASGAIWAVLAAAVLILVVWLLQAGLSASLARQKGYSGTAAFFLGLLLPMAGLIYQAGRPISPELVDERQRAQAVRIAKAIRKSEQQKAARQEEEVTPIRKKFSK